MKQLSALQHTRRSNSFRSTDAVSTGDGAIKSTAAVFWLILHSLCCLVSLILGFRFSRLLFFLLFYTSSTTTTTTIYTTAPFRSALTGRRTLPFATKTTTNHIQTDNNNNKTGVIVGRHGILIRPWPHPNREEVMKAHEIIDRVQKEQRRQYGIKNPRSLIVITPTYVRTFQALHLTGLMHSLMNLHYDLTWIVVEAGGVSNETASLLATSGIANVVHVGFEERMPVFWEGRHKMEARMRVRGLRVVRDEKLDGVVMFGDDSNMHSLEFFDEIQKVKWFAAVSVGILAYSGGSDEEVLVVTKKVEVEEEMEKRGLPVQSPACNSSEQLVGWHTFDSSPYVAKSARLIGDRAIVLPRKMEWAGFVLNSKVLWKEVEDRPDWVKDFDTVVSGGEDVDSPLSLLEDSSRVETLGDCGRKVMMWWLRVEARADSKFPARWIIDPPLEVTVPTKQTPWPDAPPKLLSHEVVINNQVNTEKRPAKTRAARSKRSSRSKRKHEAKTIEPHISASHISEK